MYHSYLRDFFFWVCQMSSLFLCTAAEAKWMLGMVHLDSINAAYFIFTSSWYDINKHNRHILCYHTGRLQSRSDGADELCAALKPKQMDNKGRLLLNLRTNLVCWEDTSARIPRPPVSPPGSAASPCQEHSTHWVTKGKKRNIAFSDRKQFKMWLVVSYWGHNILTIASCCILRLTCRPAQLHAGLTDVSREWVWTSQPRGAPHPHLKAQTHHP